MSSDLKARGGIGTRSAAALVAANMIGAGVFTTSGFALADLGRPEFVLLAWAIGGGIALCGALSYSALAARMPGNGGEYLFLSRSLHPLVGFLAGWISLFAGFTAPIAVAAHGLEAYLGASLGFELPPRVLGACAILLCGLAHGRAPKAGIRLQDIAVGVKLFAIVAFVIVGAFVLVSGGIEPPLDSTRAVEGPAFDLPAFAVTLVWISFAYSGWNAAVYIAGELDEPARTLPRALTGATLGITLLYVALNAVFLWSAPSAELAGKAEVGVVAARALGGPWAQVAISGIVALGLLTSISAMVMVGPRVYAQMADDGLFPRRFGAGGDTPRAAIALQVGLALVAFFAGGLRELLLYGGFLLGLSAAVTVSCVFLPSFRSAGEAPRVPGMPWVPAIFVVATLGSAGFTLFREPAQAGIALGTLAIGAIVYGLRARHLRMSENARGEAALAQDRARPG